MVENWDGWYDKWEPKARPWVVPDYKTYKIEGIPELEYVRDELAKKGLKDPWLRNEAWKYPKWWTRTHSMHFRDMFFGKNYMGMKWGFVAAAVWIVCDNLYWKWKFGGRPEYAHDFRDFLHELEHMKPNQ